MPPMTMDATVDPKQALLAEVGDISDIEIFNNDVLVAIYKRPEKTAGGIILTDKYRDEDEFQGKVGLVIKMGPEAFNDETGAWFNGVSIKVGDWVWYRVSDGFPVAVGGTKCRVLKDTSIRGTTQRPDRIW